MRQNLLETYARQLKVAEAYVAKNFEGKTMSSNTALTTAVLLDNTNRWITESLDSALSGATNRGDMGAWKKFCLNLTNIAVPSLIANAHTSFIPLLTSLQVLCTLTDSPLSRTRKTENTRS